MNSAAKDPWPAMRFVRAQSWWIASELVRRHPDLMIFETHPGDGMYDVLQVGQTATEAHLQSSRAMLNRAGSLQVHFGNNEHRANEVVASWPDVLAAENPHDIIKRIEAAAGWVPPSHAPATGPRALAFRVIAGLLRMTVDDRHVWDVRNEFLDSSGYDGGLNGYVAKFALVGPDLRNAPPLGLWAEPESHAWIVLRDTMPVAAITIEGYLYIEGHREEMMPVYVAHGRKLDATVVALLRGLM